MRGIRNYTISTTVEKCTVREIYQSGIIKKKNKRKRGDMKIYREEWLSIYQ